MPTARAVQRREVDGGARGRQADRLADDARRLPEARVASIYDTVQDGLRGAAAR